MAPGAPGNRETARKEVVGLDALHPHNEPLVQYIIKAVVAILYSHVTNLATFTLPPRPWINHQYLSRFFKRSLRSQFVQHCGLVPVGRSLLYRHIRHIAQLAVVTVLSWDDGDASPLPPKTPLDTTRYPLCLPLPNRNSTQYAKTRQVLSIILRSLIFLILCVRLAARLARHPQATRPPAPCPIRT